MRLVSYLRKDAGQRLGVLTESGVVDLQAAAQIAGVAAEPFADAISLLMAGEAALENALKLVHDTPKGSLISAENIRLLSPIPQPGKIVAVGLNYLDHSMESGGKEPPKSPILFAKFPTSIAGPEDDIVIPAGNPNVDYEAELAVIIGRRAKGVTQESALDYVAGYMPLNDVSARAWQFGDRQWVRGKSCDTFCPTGPWLTTRDEVVNPQTLAISARVNGETRQNSNTSKMIFSVRQLIAFITASITLEPGDIIATGTPEGVGAFRKPPVFLKPGDVVEVEIEKLGVLRNRVSGT